MTITLYVDFDNRKVYKNKEEAQEIFENNIGFLGDYDPMPIEDWLEDNYTVIDVWNGNRELFIEDYNKYVKKMFDEWFNDFLQEVTIDV